MKKPLTYSSAKLKSQIKADARSLGIAEKWAETIASRTAQHVDQWLKDRTTITEADLTRVACQKLRELSPDIAYIYKNRGKIL